MNDSHVESLPAFGLSDIIEILERRKWWVVLAAILGLVAGGAANFLFTPVYQSSTTILVEPQRVPESYVRSTVTLEVNQRLSTLQERVTSFASLTELIENVGAEAFDSSGQLTREAIMSEVRDRLSVELLNGHTAATVFEISYESQNAESAAAIVRAIASLFITENIKDRAQQAGATAEFLDRELERLRVEVDAHEEQIRIFRSERMGALPSQLDANLRSLDRLNLELAANLEAQVSASQRIALLRRQVEGVSATGAPMAVQSPHHATLQAVRNRLMEAQGIYTDEHPNVQHLKGEVARLERELLSSPVAPTAGGFATSPAAMALEQEIQSAQIDLSTRRRRESLIRGEIEKHQGRVEDTPKREQELLALTRDYNNLTETYHTLLNKKYEAAIARNLETAQKGERFKLLRPAQVPTAPSWPTPLILLPAGLSGGLAIVVLWIAILELRNPAFRSVERLAEQLGLPVFASIPRIDKDEIYEEPPAGDVDDKLVVYTAPESSPAEQYRGFLPYVLEADNCKVMLVTSAARGDGKTLTCMNLAVSLATDVNKRVLVIDGDLRRPSTHHVMHISRRHGLSDVLEGRSNLDDCAVNSKIPGLTVLPAGPSVRSPVTLLTSQGFLDLLAEAKEKYDIVLIDSPPLLPVVDTRILRRMADLVVFVIRAGGTPRDAVKRSLADMRDVAGVVFNEISTGSFRRYYHYDAYSRYAYGDPVDSGEEDEHG